MAGERSHSLLYFRNAAPRQVENSETVARWFEQRPAPVPSLQQLPRELDRFVGRQVRSEEAIAVVKQALLSQQVVAIGGQAGVGKSTLAIHLAHQLQPQFPDAQLYINLRGQDAQPIQPMQALGYFLRSWGVEAEAMPVDLAGRSQLLQLCLSSKRTLIVLDNATDEAQVRALIPSGVACVVLITSRKRLTELPETALVDLTELSEATALELLQQDIGTEALQTDPKISLSAVNLCNRLPLALCLFGKLFQPPRRLAFQAVVERLSEERQRSKQLHLSHPDVRGCFILSYAQLTDSAAQLLRRLGLLSEATFSLPLTAVLLEVELELARSMSQELVGFGLLQPVGGDRYRFTHDLIRLLARGQLAVAESAEERQAARLRICQWLLDGSKWMDLGLSPAAASQIAIALTRRSRQSLMFQEHPPVQEQTIIAIALHWFEAERLNLLTAVEWAHQAGDWDLVFQFAEVLMGFFKLHQHWTDWERISALALEGARQLGDRPQAASLLNNRGNAYFCQSQWQKARECYEQSLALSAELRQTLLQDAASQATPTDVAEYLPYSQTLVNLGTLYIQEGEPEKALSLWQSALSSLPPNSQPQQQLKKWMQSIDRTLSQQIAGSDRDRLASPSRWQSIGEAFRRWLIE
jgi:tetratricopeptide (TPR) repeat protein